MKTYSIYIYLIYNRYKGYIYYLLKDIKSILSKKGYIYYLFNTIKDILKHTSIYIYYSIVYKVYIMDIKYILIYGRPRYEGGGGVLGGVMTTIRLYYKISNLLYRLFIPTHYIPMFFNFIPPTPPVFICIGVGYFLL
jgi:hypothetical protein